MVKDDGSGRIYSISLAAVQAGTITGGAAKLCMAQPPLSRQMKELEEELGTTLFIRGKRHIRLTEEGIFLRQQAEEIPVSDGKDKGTALQNGDRGRRTYFHRVTGTCGQGAVGYNGEISQRFSRNPV